MAEKTNRNNDKIDNEEFQSHTHEFTGSTMLATPGPDELLHNHRFAGVTSEAIPEGNSHIHVVFTNTDFFFNHLHEVGVETGPAIPVGMGKHVHLAQGQTTLDFDHVHGFIFTTLIEDPLLVEKYARD